VLVAARHRQENPPLLAGDSRLLAQATGDLILVVANTKDRSGAIANGYEVWYVPPALEDETDLYERFDRVSPDAKKNLPVAKYLMWTRAADGTLGERRPVRVGDDNQTRKEVDLPIPYRESP
jgi:hypothetical protein